ncbi:MAG: DNA recombination protein RmuC [Bacteroidia bacterium]|nr:DNA recombination protein RmuC [Bacteroidia bacterium]MCO5254749.1 DNA recombination protein RmuC [Bacteroidota bacterium]MCZ2131357.1 DNA recombination protein RmuC [Bacteroidia bacterium]
MIIFFYLFVGLALGLIIGWLVKSKNSNSSSLEYDKQIAALQHEKIMLESNLKMGAEQIAELTQRTAKDTEQIIELNRRIAGLESDNRNWKERLEQHQQDAEKNEKILKERFENIANKILDEKSQKFIETNRTNLDVILNPLKEKITNFEQKVEQTYTNEAKERHSLKDEVKNLVELNTKLNTEAQNLTRALKGDRKKQGNWGELMLDNILESSGLREGMEYEKQYTTTNDESQRIYPDFVVKLPEHKHLIIDSKVSLVAYERFVNTEDAETQQSAINEHIISVKNHVRDLSDKNYFKAGGLNSPDFVLLFMPIESSFAAAIEADADLFNFAWEKKIVIVSPSTLLATLKTVASLWRLEKQNLNAAKIASEAGGLYDKFNGLVEELKKLGNQINTVQGTYKDAFSKLSTGNGNLVSKVHKIKLLGAKTSKQIDLNLVNEALENDKEEEFNEDNLS